MLLIIHLLLWCQREMELIGVEQFRPIALCNVVYKVISKIIATQLRQHIENLIHPSQLTFIPNRAISDNVIINHEVMTYLNTKKGQNGFMTIKVDMAKAYNRIEWNILISILKVHGFSEDVGKQVYGCVSLVYYSVLTNGSPYGFFAGSRGIHQGDPMSPPLFIITIDLLSRILVRAET